MINIYRLSLAFEGYEKIKSIVIMGATKYKIAKCFQDLREKKGINIPVYIVNNMEEAVNKCREIAKEGDIVTLSPAVLVLYVLKILR